MSITDIKDINDLVIYDYYVHQRKYVEPFKERKVIQDLLDFQKEFTKEKINNTPFEECYKQTYFMEKSLYFLPCSYEEAIEKSKKGHDVEEIKTLQVEWSNEKNQLVKIKNNNYAYDARNSTEAHNSTNALNSTDARNSINIEPQNLSQYRYRLPPVERKYTICWLDDRMKHFIINIEGQPYTIFALGTINEVPEDPFPNIKEKELKLTTAGVVDYYNNYLIVVKPRTWPLALNKKDIIPHDPYYLYEKSYW
jgi:hypothetical protein